MTHIIIKSEGDMEDGIEIATKLALEKGKNKTLEITFPSKFLCSIFMKNLFLNFVIKEVPRDSNLDVMLNVPDQGDYNE